MICLAIVTITVIVAALRVGGERGPVFMAWARVYLGVLIGVGLAEPNVGYLLMGLGLVFIHAAMASRERSRLLKGDY